MVRFNITLHASDHQRRVNTKASGRLAPHNGLLSNAARKGRAPKPPVSLATSILRSISRRSIAYEPHGQRQSEEEKESRTIATLATVSLGFQGAFMKAAPSPLRECASWAWFVVEPQLIIPFTRGRACLIRSAANSCVKRPVLMSKW